MRARLNAPCGVFDAGARTPGTISARNWAIICDSMRMCSPPSAGVAIFEGGYETAWIDLQVPWVSWLVQVDMNLLVFHAQLSKGDVHAMCIWAAMVSVKSDLVILGAHDVTGALEAEKNIEM